MSGFTYQVGDFILGYPIVAVNNPYVTINLILNISITADLSNGPVDLSAILEKIGPYVPPQPKI